jgi:hypothetical protein
VVVELARGTGLHGGGRDGAACCSGEVPTRCFWLWQLAWKVVLGGVLSPLSEEDGAPHWSCGGGEMGPQFARSEIFAQPLRCWQRRHLLVSITLLKALPW